MIHLEKTGNYKLIQTKANTKILSLDNQIYAWIEPKYIGDLLVISHKEHQTDCVLSIGTYNIYNVVDEPYLSDNMHLELETGKNRWQGYIMLSELPGKEKKRSRIIPTNELITGNPKINAERRAE